jgi:hypothetical protein
VPKFPLKDSLLSLLRAATHCLGGVFTNLLRKPWCQFGYTGSSIVSASAFLLRASGKLESLSDGGLWLGVIPAAPYVSGCFEVGGGRCVDDLFRRHFRVAQLRRGRVVDARLESQLRHAPTGTADAMLFAVLGAVQLRPQVHSSTICLSPLSVAPVADGNP